jgi:hypothetical protein
MPRVETWPEDLHAVVRRHRALPFVWGETDCACLFRDAVVAMTGADPLAGMRPWYSATTAARSLKHLGFSTALDLMRDRFEEIAPAAAGRGDCGFLEERDALSAPAIILGAEAVSRNEQGFVIVPVSLITIAFRI